MDICQPGSPVEFLSGGEQWTDADVAQMGVPSGADAENMFTLHPPHVFDENGDFAHAGGPPAPLSGPTSCTFKITPADPAEMITIFALPVIGYSIHSDKQFSDLTTDMTNCGDTYLKINEVRKCGSFDYMGDPELTFNAGESVEFTLEAVNNAQIDFGMMGVMVYTGPTAPQRSLDYSKTN